MEVRAIKKKGACRGCGKDLEPGDVIFYNYSSLCSGTSTIFCVDCMKRIKQLIQEWEDEDERLVENE